MRDIESDYKAAYIAEYEAYRTAGRSKDAAAVARILRDTYGHDIAPERADAKAPEDTAEPSPAKRTGRPKLPRDNDGKIIRD